MKNKTAFVTGGSRGIGEVIAVKLAENRADVVITYVSSKDAAKEVVAKTESFGVKGLAIKADANAADGEFANMFSSMIALGRYGKSEERAELAAFLASPRANYMTGATINIDGDFSA